MYSSNWWTHVEIAFPGDSSSQMTIRMHTVGSGLMDDTESVDLPEPTYADTSMISTRKSTKQRGIARSIGSSTNLSRAV
jgi:hypothetical protein